VLYEQRIDAQHVYYQNKCISTASGMPNASAMISVSNCSLSKRRTSWQRRFVDYIVRLIIVPLIGSHEDALTLRFDTRSGSQRKNDA
jgi:hypothetical protein